MITFKVSPIKKSTQIKTTYSLSGEKMKMTVKCLDSILNMFLTTMLEDVDLVDLPQGKYITAIDIIQKDFFE